MKAPIEREVDNYIIVANKEEPRLLYFRVHKIIGRSESGERVFNENEVELSGSIKWNRSLDLCIEELPQNFSQHEDAAIYQKLLACLYSLAEELIAEETIQ